MILYIYVISTISSVLITLWLVLKHIQDEQLKQELEKMRKIICENQKK